MSDGGQKDSVIPAEGGNRVSFEAKTLGPRPRLEHSGARSSRE